MPRITINEVDLTKASLQPSPTDIVFVPGLSCLSDATSDITFCETLSDFENSFGKYPAVINMYRVYDNNGSILKKKYTVSNYETFSTNFYNKIYKNSTYKRIAKYGGTLTGITQLVLGYTNEIRPSESTITDYLEDCGLELVNDDVVVPETAVTDYFDFDYDMSYVYAKELLMSGISVIYKVVNGTDYESILSSIKTLFINSLVNPDGLRDKGEYSIKYLTSGGYPSFSYKVINENNEISYEFVDDFSTNMANLAGSRGDAVALIDPADCTLTSDNRNLSIEQLINPTNIYFAAEELLGNIDNAEYASLFVPWGLYNTQAVYTVGNGSTLISLPQLDSVIMPPSFGYLQALAKSIRINNNWLAIAGIARGQVPYIRGLYTTKRLSNTLANEYQPRNGRTSINAITDIKPYGLTIWGNRTMKNNLKNAMGGEDGLTATSFLNIRNMVSDVKKTAYIAAKTLMFEQNSDVLWVNFLSRITPLLDQLMSGQGLSDYKVIKNPTDEKAKLKATIKLYPIYAVEDFDITIELSDEDVSVV